MTYDDANSIIEKIGKLVKKVPYKKVHIHYFGGEPLLNKSILKYLHIEISSLCSINGLIYITNITTNGSNFNDDIFQSIKFDYIQLTFDGRENIHNQLRKSDDFHYKDEIALLEKILNYSNSTIILRMNVCEQNKDEILIFYRTILEKYGCKRIEVNLNRMIKYHEKDNFDMLTPKEYAGIFFKLKLLMEEITGIYTLPKAIKNPCNFTSDSSFSISPDGFCNFCSGLVENGTTLFCNIDVYNRKRIKFREQCSKCKFLPLCLGGCIVQHELGVGCCTYEKYFINDILIHFIDNLDSSPN